MVGSFDPIARVRCQMFLCRFDDRFDRQLFEFLQVLVNNIADVGDVRARSQFWCPLHRHTWIGP